ncbi:MarR family transcriptional regulator [Aliihoeflea aestuarii]|jgi:DNA-binding MarR family transcriptional regulator|uniref:MarR family winged helix-turn-helix transcriptional regulator n=1 Tax=Aliihoeflea aestuarii TaxID=453840 RepID=UPI00209372FA|nr:MarR family transcriptional regulator [Aliihoeflea aestuarii]MCO6391703.1 MarR family transcriptional regulator [Aliihoeflea aestuarii]
MVSAPLDTVERSAVAKERLRLWIRLLRASRLIENELRERLKRDYETTLPRFDVMAALYRQPDGMAMSDLSRFLLVSNGNVTGIVERLVKDGFVSRAAREGDRRAFIVKLTPIGETRFTEMAAAHENWIEEFLGDVADGDAVRLSATLKAFRSNWEEAH